MTRLRGFAHLVIDPPVIRRGKAGHFCDAALEGVSHHAIVPNVNVMNDKHASPGSPMTKSGCSP